MRSHFPPAIKRTLQYIFVVVFYSIVGCASQVGVVVLESVSFFNARWNTSNVTKLVSGESLHFFAFFARWDWNVRHKKKHFTTPTVTHKASHPTPPSPVPASSDIYYYWGTGFVPTLVRKA